MQKTQTNSHAFDTGLIWLYDLSTIVLIFFCFLLNSRQKDTNGPTALDMLNGKRYMGS